MSLITLGDLSKSFDGSPLLEGVSASIPPRKKIGLVGRNGCGKSTLLRIVAGRIPPDDGVVHRARNLRIGFQEQELEAPPERTLIEEMRDVFKEDFERRRRLRELEDRLGDASFALEHERILRRYQDLTDKEIAEGVGDPERLIRQTLLGLGLPEEVWDQPLHRFSGGERNLLAMARVILGRPDLFLLDEPTNHLDMEGIDWFISFIRRCSSAALIVSHDRHLLDLVADEIWELKRGKLSIYAGNYSDYERKKAEDEALRQRQWRNQQKLIRRLEFQARRLRDMARAYDDPGQAKRARAMLSRIERMELVDAPESEDSPFAATLANAPRHGDLALRIEDFSHAYGERVLFQRASLEINFGERVCLVGPNGCGKSTLMDAILREGAWDNPRIRVGKSVRLGRYEQLHDRAIRPGATLLEWIMEVTHLDKTPASNLAHRFRFSRDDLDREVQTLSGGEKSRLQLARLVHEGANFILLDEPTNHLDIPSAEKLEEMLDEFTGTLLVISHDRYFLDRLANVVVEVKDERLVRHHVTFAEWWENRKSAAKEGPGGALRLRIAKDSGGVPAEDREARRKERERKKARRKEERRLKRRVEELETLAHRLEGEVKEIERALAAHWTAENASHEEGLRLDRALTTRRAELEQALESWEAAALELDSIDS